jgi:hypothetical protein
VAKDKRELFREWQYNEIYKQMSKWSKVGISPQLAAVSIHFRRFWLSFESSFRFWCYKPYYQGTLIYLHPPNLWTFEKNNTFLISLDSHTLSVYNKLVIMELFDAHRFLERKYEKVCRTNP